jgi:hypothetical protein
MSTVVRIAGDGFAGLVRAVEESRRGARVEYLEPRLRAGGAMATESFLSPFRFNLGPTLVPRPPLPSLHVLEPQLLLDVDGVALTHAALSSGGAPELRSAFALFRGYDPASPEAVAEACAGADDLVLVSGGNGLAVACLLDELVAGGSTVVEGVGDVDPGPVAAEGLGTCRLFVGLRGPARPLRALATAVGFHDERSLLDGLDALRAGGPPEPLGFLVSNAHLDANPVEPALWSLTFQGVLPFGADVSREDYTGRVLEALGIDPEEVIFRLLWLPPDTGESLMLVSCSASASS